MEIRIHFAMEIFSGIGADLKSRNVYRRTVSGYSMPMSFLYCSNVFYVLLGYFLGAVYREMPTFVRMEIFSGIGVITLKLWDCLIVGLSWGYIYDPY